MSGKPVKQTRVLLGKDAESEIVAGTLSNEPVKQTQPPGYPTLREFRPERRAFLRTLGMTAAVVVTGAWPRLADAGDPGGELPRPGGMRAAPHFELRVPAQGAGSVYLASDEYLSFACVLFSYEPGFADYVAARAAELTAAIGDLLSSQQCAHLLDDAKRAALELKVLASTNERYRAATGLGDGAYGVRLEIVGCELNMPLAGDIAGPPFPGDD